jgi:signal transduction histidine kinase
VCVRVRDARDLGRNLEGLRVTISDSGSGIPSEYRRKIFEPFFTTKENGGTGLGLWVVQGILAKHGGTIRVRSRTRAGSSGTCFSVFLPLDMSTMVRADTAA